ncbi:MAG TPA: hypothetical protein VEZ14_09105 [Dehalococcoidia bacterium]|nr:hypothetical protein [Dehalococcoidia bacterium]
MTRRRRMSIAILLALAILPLAACGRAIRNKSSVTPTPSTQADRVAAIKTSYAQGTPVPTVPARAPDLRFGVTDMSFIGPDRGWVLGVSGVASEVLYTNDAGRTWTKQYVGAIIGSRIDFVDPAHGWVVGRAACTAAPGPGCDGVVLATSDGGATWKRSSPTAEWLTDVSFVDAADGWALAIQNCNRCQVAHLLRTIDGGATWETTVLPSGRYESRPRALFRFGSSGIIVTGSGILVTHDGGTTWIPRANGCSAASFLSNDWFADPLHGWTICEDGKAGGTTAEKFVYATADGGSSWRLRSEYMFDAATPPAGVGPAPAPGATDIVFASASNGWLSTELGLYSTADGGSSWARIWSSDANFGRLQFLNDRVGFAAMNYTSFAVTVDGGADWQVRTPLP